MTFRVQGTIEINGAQAKAEAKAVAGELKKVGTDATGMATASRGAAEATGRLATGARTAAGNLRALAAAERQAAAEAVVMSRNQTLAAGSVGNLAAQFNDIGVMLAAGQNPLQLALQQGTQITQVFGNMGAGAAVRALGQAMLSILNPLNLITIGSIAAGAALFQWLTGSDEEVRSLDDALQALANSGDAVSKANKRAELSTADLRKEFGAAAEAARELLREEAALARQRAEGQGRAISGAVQQELDLFLNDSAFATGNQVQLAEIFDLSIWQGEARRAINEVISAFRQLDSARGLEGQIAAAERLREVFRSAALASGAMSDEEERALQAINTLILDRLRLLQQERDAQAALAEANGRYPGIGAAKEALDYWLAEQVAIREANAAARELVATLQDEEVVRNQILIFGRDSDLVVQNRLAAEREILAAQLEAQGVASTLAAEVLAAWDNAKGFNAEAAGMPGFLAAAAGAAAGVAGNLWDAVKAQIALKQEQATQDFYAFQGDDERGSQRDGRISAGNWRAQQNRAIANRRAAEYRLSQLGISTGAGTRGGAAAAREETRAVEDLIAQLEAELELERELDPVKREMIRYREELKDATAAERAEVEALIAQREREKAVTESLQWVGEQSGNALVDALMGASDAGERLIDTLKRAVLQALLLGTGPLAGIFGGGLLGDVLGGFLGIPDVGVITFAEGGIVHGAGGPTDDKIPARLSAGEFVVNAAATRRNRRLLEAINAAPGYATGGIVGAASDAAGGALGAVTNNFNVDARGAQDPAAVEMAARRGMKAALDDYRRGQLPSDIRRSIDNPRVTRF